MLHGETKKFAPQMGGKQQQEPLRTMVPFFYYDFSLLIIKKSLFSAVAVYRP